MKNSLLFGILYGIVAMFIVVSAIAFWRKKRTMSQSQPISSFPTQVHPDPIPRANPAPITFHSMNTEHKPLLWAVLSVVFPILPFIFFKLFIFFITQGPEGNSVGLIPLLLLMWIPLALFFGPCIALAFVFASRVFRYTGPTVYPKTATILAGIGTLMALGALLSVVYINALPEWFPL